MFCYNIFTSSYSEVLTSDVVHALRVMGRKFAFTEVVMSTLTIAILIPGITQPQNGYGTMVLEHF